MAVKQEFESRFAKHKDELEWLFMELYHNREGLEVLEREMADAYDARSAELKALDKARAADPNWYKRGNMFGMTMYTDPILWHGEQQLLGEEIKIYMNDSTIDWAHIINQALTVEKKDSIHYNQVSGKEMKAFFIDGDMRLVEVNGNVLVVYYPVEEKDSSLIMMNYSEGGLLKMYLKERRMERGVFVGKTTGTAYPLDQIPPDKSRLPSFVWFDYIRPLNKEDIFEWRAKKAGEVLKKSDRKPVTSPRNMHIKRNNK